MTIRWDLVFSTLGVLIGLFGLFAFLLQGRSYWQGELEKDPLLRREIIERLRDASLGGHYRGSLERALAWLDRMFGEPGSSQALGLCILIAVGYAYATFFLGWGLGGSGGIAGFEFLPKAMAQPGRGIVAWVVVLLPVAVFFFARSLARFMNRRERGFKSGLLRRWHRLGWRRRGFGITYRLFSGLAVFGLVWLLLLTSETGSQISAVFFIVIFPLFGAIAGKSVARRMQHGFWADVWAFVLGAIAVAIVYAVVVALIAVAAIPVAIAVAVAVAVIGTGAGAVAVVVVVVVFGVVVGVVVGAGDLAVAGRVAPRNCPLRLSRNRT